MAQAIKGLFNYTGSLSEPFTLALGGYISYIDLGTGSVNQMYGRMKPAWLRREKRHSRGNTICKHHGHRHNKRNPPPPCDSNT